MQNTLATALSSLVWTRKNLLLRSYAKELFTVWYCSRIQLHSFTPPLNSPTLAQRVAVDLSFKQNADRPVWKKFTRKSSKLPRSGCQNIFPPFFFCQSATGKIRTAPSPRRFVPPNANGQIPYYQLVIEYVPTVTVAEPKICHPRLPSYQNHTADF